jgi:outer membrane protein
MNRISIIINSILIIAVGILFFLYAQLKSNSLEITSSESGKSFPKLITDTTLLKNAKIAYINIDSLNEKYEYIKDKSKEIRGRQSAIEGSLNSMYTTFQQEVADLQQAAQAGIRPESELKKEEARLQQKQMEIANKEKQLQVLGEEVATTQSDMLQNVSKFIERYNNNKFDYILAYTTNNISSVLYANSSLEITNEIVNGLNEEYRKNKKPIK